MQLASVPSRRWDLEPMYVIRMVPIRCNRYNISLFLYSRQLRGSQLSVPTCTAEIYPIIRFAWDACWHIEPTPPINENTAKKLPHLCAVGEDRGSVIYIYTHLNTLLPGVQYWSLQHLSNAILAVKKVFFFWGHFTKMCFVNFHPSSQWRLLQKLHKIQWWQFAK